MSIFIVVAAVMAAVAAAAVALPLLRDRQSRLVGAVAGILVAAAAAALYPLWSNWNWHAPAQAGGPDVSAMVAKLESHMRDDPNDLKGWLMLGRSYLALERADDAVLAYDHAHRLDSGSAEASLGLGEAMSLRAGGNITAAAADLFEQALKAAPNNPKILLYAGFAAASRGDNAAAIARWQAVKAQHPPEQIEKMLDARIAELSAAGAAGGMAAASGAAPAGAAAPNGAGVPSGVAAGAVAVTVPASRSAGDGPALANSGTPGAAAAGAEATVNLSIAPQLKSRLTRELSLFVFAREPGVQGPPLAAKRLTSAALGTQVTLSAADSMMPGRVLVSGRQIAITARISFSGQPLPAAGDLYGELTYNVGRDGALNLVIDRVAE